MSYKIMYNGIDANEIDWEVEFKVNKVSNNRIEIPQGQREVIKKALAFYIETSRKLNSVPTESEEYFLFDAKQLSAMMDYPIHIKISEEEIEGFCGKHGVDFPKY